MSEIEALVAQYAPEFPSEIIEQFVRQLTPRIATRASITVGTGIDRRSGPWAWVDYDDPNACVQIGFEMLDERGLRPKHIALSRL